MEVSQLRLNSIVIAVAAATALACSSDVETHGAGGSEASCGPSLGAPGSCPIMTDVAENAFANVESECNISGADIDTTDMMSPALTPNGELKACASCTCRAAIFDYYAVYMNCSDDPVNGSFASNMYDVARDCA